MKIKKKAFVVRHYLNEDRDDAGGDVADMRRRHVNGSRDIVEVEYETDAPELDMVQAAAVIGRGGKVMQITNSEGRPPGDNCVIPFRDQSVFLYPKARYVEVPQ